MTRDELRTRVVEIVSQISEIPADKLRSDESLYRHGIDSLAAVNIAYEIGLLLGSNDVPAMLLVEHDTIEKLVDFAASW